MGDDNDLVGVTYTSRVAVDAPQETNEDGELTTFFGSSDEWVRKFFLPSDQRRVTARGQTGAFRGRPGWESAEAMHRIEVLWCMWEELRDQPAELSDWWINHLDARPGAFLAPGGPFASSTDEDCPGESLPHSSIVRPERQR